jgi:acyl carrier protein
MHAAGVLDEEILKRLAPLIEDPLGLYELQLRRDTTAQDVPGRDSLVHVRIVVGAEQALRVRFTTREIVSLKSVGDLGDLIKARAPQ